MDELDKKLEEIELRMDDGVWHLLSREAIEQIKQAFIDAKWRKASKAQLYFEEVIYQNKRLNFYKAVDAYLDAGGSDDFVIMSRTDWERNAHALGWIKVPKEVEETWREYNRIAGLMSGSEWYSKFEKEMCFMMPMHWATADGKESHEILVREDILELAKKASGIA